MRYLTAAIGTISCLAVSQAFGAINVVSDTDTGGWIAISGNYDYLSDQQTGQPSSDIVGGSGGSYNLNDSGFFTNWDPGTASNTDGTLGFRVRLDDHDGNNTPAYNGFLWVGIDADTNDVNASTNHAPQPSVPVSSHTAQIRLTMTGKRSREDPTSICRSWMTSPVRTKRVYLAATA